MTTYNIGDYVKVNEELCVVEAQLNNQYSLKNFFTNKSFLVSRQDITPVFDFITKSKALDGYSESEKEIAFERFNIIKPVLLHPGDGQIVDQVAKNSGYSKVTIYAWVKKFMKDGLAISLAPNERADRGASRLSVELEEIIRETIEKEYTTLQKKRVSEIIELILAQCYNKQIKAPHPNTIRKRIKALGLYQSLKSRLGNKNAEQELGLNDGISPIAKAPLQLAEVDHTKLDIILVDETSRKPMGRPWLTTLIDEYSRAVLGFYVSFQTPGYLGLGQCIAHSILPKNQWLFEFDIDSNKWPIHGFPQTIQCDNAKEMRSNALIQTCLKYNINLEYRPVRKSHYGGHIERFGKTVNTKVHSLKGTTYSSIKERGDISPKKYACFSLSELESWLTHFIVNEYHHKLHRGINMSPLHKFFMNADGEKNFYNPNGLHSSNLDPLQVKIDFLPQVKRTIQRQGISVLKIFYHSFELRAIKLLAKNETNSKKRSKEFIVKVDPRNIKYIYLLHPIRLSYIQIPARNLGMQNITQWEWKAAMRSLKEQGIKSTCEDTIYKSVLKRKEIELAAEKKTKAARKIKLLPTKPSVAVDFQTENNNSPEEQPKRTLVLKFDPSKVEPYEIRR